MNLHELIEWLISQGVKVNGSYLDAERKDSYGREKVTEDGHLDS